MSAGLALLLLAAQAVEPRAAALLRARQESFLEAWQAADAARREVALRELERLAAPGAAAGASPSAQALGRAWRALVREGAAGDAEGTALEILAEALELRAVPGVFEAGLPGEPLSVRVSSPAGARPAGRVELELAWLAPAAQSEALHARASEAWPDAFTAEGFELFVRTPPRAAPGTWRLRLELSDGERRARVPDLAVECIAAQRVVGDDARAQALRLELEAWRAGGLPATDGLLAADLLDERGGRFEPFFAPDEGVWVWHPQAELRGVAVVLSPARDAAHAPLCGARGAAWRAAAAASGLLVVPWRAAARGVGTAVAGLEQLGPRLASFAPGCERLPRVLVARGDSAAHVALAPPERPPFDAWVLSWAGAAPPRLPWPALPARVLRAGAPAAGEALSSATPEHLALPGTGHVLLDDLLAPTLARELAAALGGRTEAR